MHPPGRQNRFPSLQKQSHSTLLQLSPPLTSLPKAQAEVRGEAASTKQSRKRGCVRKRDVCFGGVEGVGVDWAVPQGPSTGAALCAKFVPVKALQCGLHGGLMLLRQRIHLHRQLLLLQIGRILLAYLQVMSCFLAHLSIKRSDALMI